MKYKESQRGLVFVPLLLIALIVGVTIAYISKQNPLLFNNLFTQRVQTIKTPKPLIGNLTPARDLRGTWVSSLRGRGIQVYGQFVAGRGTTRMYESGDIELIINNVQGNTAFGTIRYSNLSAYGTTFIPGYGNISIPRQYVRNSGASPVQIRVSSSRLDFGTIRVNGVTSSMQGSYTTDIISGTITTTLPAYGVLKGQFYLNRVR